MKNIFTSFIITFITVFAITACGPGEDEEAPPDDACGTGVSVYTVVQVNNDITTPTTWTYGNVYVINTYDFYVTSTLTIEPGVIVKFPQAAPYMMLNSSGKVIANGTACRHIVFTSHRDDAHGGDTNGDGAATSPATEDWFYINTNGSDNSVFNYCDFYYGGGGASYNSTLYLYGKATTVTSCVFAHNLGGPDGSFYCGALDANDAETGTVITGNTFYDNILPLSISSQVNIEDSNNFHKNAAGNTMNGIFLHAGDDFTNNITWAETEVAFVMYDNSLWVNSGCTLTLGNNVTIKFTGNVLHLQDGDSAIVNHGGAGVAFTSFRDDSHKGDTNGDGYSSGAFGDWLGIYDDYNSVYFGWGNIFYDSI